MSTENINLFNLGEEAHITVDLIRVYNEEHLSKNPNSLEDSHRKEYMKYMKVFEILYKNKDVCSLLEHKFIKGEDGLSRKDEAKAVIYKVQTRMFKALEKLHDSNYNCYVEVIDRLRFNPVLNYKIGE
jgi:hypothetical protein